MNGDRDDAAIWEAIREWMTIAERDRLAVVACLAIDPPLAEIAAYHCQQSAEKLLKAFLVLAGHRFGKTHELAELGAAVKSHFPALDAVIAPVEGWTLWGVAYRYPAESSPPPLPTTADLTDALIVLDRLMAALRGSAPAGP